MSKLILRIGVEELMVMLYIHIYIYIYIYIYNANEMYPNLVFFTQKKLRVNSP